MKRFTILWKEESFTVYFHGEVTLNDLIDANNEIIANPKVDRITHYYFDFCNVEELKLSDRELNIYAKYDSVMPKFLRRSLVCSAFRVPTSIMKEKWNRFLALGHQAWPRKAFISCLIAETWIQDGCSHEAQRLEFEESRSTAIA